MVFYDGKKKIEFKKAEVTKNLKSHFCYYKTLLSEYDMNSEYITSVLKRVFF